MGAKRMRRSFKSVSGATILEAVFAGAIMALFMGGLFELNARNVQLLKSGKESFAATIVLEERLEQLRSGKWADITSADYLQTILAQPASSSAQLPKLSEQISITEYPASVPAAAANTVTCGKLDEQRARLGGDGACRRARHLVRRSRRAHARP
jgi:hypothetical protein